MCNQTVSLAAAELEKRGISTVTLQFMKEIALKVGPPRALWVPFPHGFALGKPGDHDGQQKVLMAALSLLSRKNISPRHLELYETN